jgi:hypothetical protein
MIYVSLLSKSTVSVTKTGNEECKKYLWEFIRNNSQIIPNNYEIYKCAIRHMLMIQTNRKEGAQIYSIILEIFLSYPYHYQVFYNSFGFIL